MLQPRLIPVLLLQDNGLVKTTRFANPRYIGDPVNAVKIFNDRGADELLLVDLDASNNGKPLDTSRLREIVTEAFMPVSYGGGVRTLEHIESVVKCGVEKVVINTAAFTEGFITRAATEFGSSTLCVSVDYKVDWLGRSRVYSDRGQRRHNVKPLNFCKTMSNAGAGEIMLHNIDKDGTMSGYDVALVEQVCHSVDIPVVASGGASGYIDMAKVLAAGASAASAGSAFVFSGAHKAVLINYPDEAWRQKNIRR
jgi:imidazole glycerol-phosphate synthase subunit HisF